jgi:hypothetical protein
MTDAQHTLYLWHIKRTAGGGYDTYSDAVVVSEDAGKARLIHPGNEYTSSHYFWKNDEWYEAYTDNLGIKGEEPVGDSMSWVFPESVHATRIGMAAKELEEGQIICASFHAG